MKYLKHITLALALATSFSACKKDDEETLELTPDGEVAISDNLVGVWKLSYNNYDGVQDGTIGELTLTITGSGTIITENVATVYNWWEEKNGWDGETISNLETEDKYEMLKFETTTIASNRMKIGDKPFYWSVYEDDNDDEIIYLDITDIYNSINSSFTIDAGGWDDGIVDYPIFPNNSFVKQ